MRLRPSAVLAALLLVCSVLPAKQKSAANAPAPPSGHPVSRWLVLGPSAEALPLFHQEDRGKYSIEDLLKADRGISPRIRPAAGVEGWAERATVKGGSVELPTDVTRDGRDYATAWLAAYVTVDRFRSFDVEATGNHPRRLWIDGEPVATGGTKKEANGGEAKGTAKLEQGTHAVLVETIYDPERGAPWSVGATLKPAKADAPGDVVTITDSIDPRREITLADVLDAPQLTSVAVSGDGSLVAAGISRIVPGTDDGESWVEVRRVKDGSLVRTLRGGVAIGQVAWAPKGHKLSYAARDRREAGKDSSSLWLADIDGGDTALLVERVENFASYQWAPDGASVVYVVTAKSEPDKRGVKLRENLLDRRAGWRDKTFLYQVSVPSGITRRLTAGGLSTLLADFSPDGERLLLIREVEDVAARPFTRKELWELNLTTLYGKKLRDSRFLNNAAYAPDGRRILLLAGPSEFGDLGRNVSAGKTPNENDGQIFVLDPATGQAESLSRTFEGSISSAEWSRFDDTIYVKATIKDGSGVFRYDAAAKQFVALDAGGPLVNELAFAQDAASAVCVVNGPWSPETLQSIDLRGGPPRLLAAPAASSFATVTKGEVISFPVKLKSGGTMDGRVYLPPGFERSAAARYPAIVNYYGGTLPVFEEFGGRYPREWWAARGYVVYVPQPSGAIGYGQDYSAVHVNDWGRTTSDEILEGLSAFLAAYPAVDPKRVGCIGASYGGFMTMTLVAKTDRFAAAVAHAGIADLTSYWGEGYWGYSYSATATADSFPWNRKDVYVDRSPIFAADKVKTPLLLTHGAADTNVPVGESETFYTALKLNGAPVELLTVDGQDHHILDHAKRQVWSRSILAWFDRWLKGQPQWWDDLYPKKTVASSSVCRATRRRSARSSR
jgi:dipeptidyl aminopeptidase/acylaminoacyl peptidase